MTITSFDLCMVLSGAKFGLSLKEIWTSLSQWLAPLYCGVLFVLLLLFVVGSPHSPVSSYGPGSVPPHQLGTGVCME